MAIFKWAVEREVGTEAAKGKGGPQISAIFQWEEESKIAVELVKRTKGGSKSCLFLNGQKIKKSYSYM